MCTHGYHPKFWFATRALLAGILATMLLTLNLPAAASTPPDAADAAEMEAAEAEEVTAEAPAEEVVADPPAEEVVADPPAEEVVADEPPADEMAAEDGPEAVADEAEPPAVEDVAEGEDAAAPMEEEPVVDQERDEKAPKVETAEGEPTKDERAGVAADEVTAANSGTIKVNEDGGTEDNDNNPQALCGLFYVVGEGFPVDGTGRLEITLQSGVGSGLPYSADVEVVNGEFSHAVTGVTGHIRIDFTAPGANNEKTKVVWVCTDTGTLTVAKTTSGTATVPPGTDFDFTVACTYGSSGLAVPLAAGDSAFSLLPGGSRVITVPQDADCTVEESDPGGATSTGITVTPSSQQTSVNTTPPPTAGVTIGTNTNTDVTVTFDNVFNTAPPITWTLTVTKVVDKHAPDDDFVFSFACDNGETPDDVAIDNEGGTDATTVVADGTTCTVTEENPQNAKSTTYVVDTGTATEGETSSPVLMTADHEVTFTNAYEGHKRTLTIVKVVNGPPPANGFVFSFACDKGPTPANVTIPNTGGTDATTKVAGGAACTVTETNPQSATSTTYSVDGGTALEGTVAQLSKGSDHTVTFTNTYPSPKGSATISKVVTGNRAPASGAYEICLTPVGVTAGSAAEICETLLRSGSGTVTHTFTDLPVGVWALSEKSATPGTTGAAPVTTINTPTVTVTDGGTATGQVTNAYGSSGSVQPYNPPNLIPGIEVVKIAAVVDPDIDGVITYTYIVTNTGDLTLTGLTLVDDVLGSITLPTTTLAAGGAITVTGTHTITPSDLDAGSITNVATVTGLTSSNTPVTDTDDATVELPQRPGLAVAKSADLEVAELADVITYTYVVTNTGNVTLTGIEIDDDVIGPILTGGGSLAQTLGAGETLTITRGYEVTDEDVERGYVTNVATAAGQPPGPLAPVTGEATVTVPVSETFVEGTGFITVTKKVKGEPGDSSYAFTAVCDGFALGENNEAFTIGPDGGSKEIGVAVPEGTTCTITEARDGGADATTVQHDDGKVVDGNTMELVVEDGLTEVMFVNTFDIAPIVGPKPHQPTDEKEPTPTLPATGTDANIQLLLGLAALALGGTMLRAGRGDRGNEGWLRG